MSRRNLQKHKSRIPLFGVRDLLEEQEKHDIALDKLSVKEYEDPFKG